MSEIQHQSTNRPPARAVWLWVTAILVIIVGIGLAVVIAQRGRRSTMIDSQFQRLDRLGTALQTYAKTHEGAFPPYPDEILSAADLATILMDAQSGEPLIYRVAPASGEPIRYDFMGDRIVAWTPHASYRGNRAVLLNNCDVKFAPDSMLDLSAQRFLGSDPLNQMVPKLSAAPEEEDDSTTPDQPQEPATRKDG